MRKKIHLPLVSILTRAVAAAAQPMCSQDIPPQDFFVDPSEGSNVLIVVGSGAAAMDVVSATMIAAKVASMTYAEYSEDTSYSEKMYGTIDAYQTPPLEREVLWCLVEIDS